MPERYQLEEYMDMYDGKVVLCGANSYEEKYYLNPDFEQLPDDVKQIIETLEQHGYEGYALSLIHI